MVELYKESSPNYLFLHYMNVVFMFKWVEINPNGGNIKSQSFYYSYEKMETKSFSESHWDETPTPSNTPYCAPPPSSIV